MSTPLNTPACAPSSVPLDTSAASRTPIAPDQAIRDAANNMVSEGNASSAITRRVSAIDTQAMAESRKGAGMHPPSPS
ncbi:MAG: hypothetical protein ACKVS8_03160 [Phycisphaerales bacterium]